MIHKLCDASKLQNDVKSSKDLSALLKICVLKQYVVIHISMLFLLSDFSQVNTGNIVMLILSIGFLSFSAFTL